MWCNLAVCIIWHNVPTVFGGDRGLVLVQNNGPALAHAAGIMLIGQIAMEFCGALDQYTAATLGDNANATLGYATRFISLMLGVGAASVGRAALPVLADVTRRGDAVRARAIALKWSLMMVAIGLAVALVAMWLAPVGISLLYERGAFSAADTGASQLGAALGLVTITVLLWRADLSAAAR